MGKAYSYFNVWAVSTIIHASLDDIDEVFKVIEQYYSLQQQTLQMKMKKDSQVVDIGSYYIVRRERFIDILKQRGFHPSDVDILTNLFILIDTRNFNECDIREVMVSFLLLVTISVAQCFEMALLTIGRGEHNEQYLDKKQILRVFTLLNDTCYFFGDKYLHLDQVKDLVDSLYTSIGKIDGVIYYPHYLEFLSTHPIIELFTSAQFQGAIQDKLLDDKALERLVYFQK